MKKQRNIRKKSEQNLQKRRFPAFSAGKNFLSQIGLGHVLSIAKTHLWAKIKKLMTKSWGNAKKQVFQHIWLKHILGTIVFHQCANFHEKISSTCREIQEIPFFRMFRPFLESSGYKNQFNWQMNHAWWWALLLVMFLSEKTTKYKEKVRTKSAKTAISGIFPEFSAEKKFSQKSDSAMLWVLLICIFVQKIGKN